MAYVTEKSIFYHIPKTGGLWVKKAIEVAGIPGREALFRKAHQPLQLKSWHSIPEDTPDEEKKGKFSYAFVRHPLSWYQSYWTFTRKWMEASPDVGEYEITKKRGRNNYNLVRYWKPDFEEFILFLLNHKDFPRFSLERKFKYFLDGNLDFIGKQENLREDLITALTLAGEEFDKDAIRQLEKVNTAFLKKGEEDLLFLSDSTLERLLEKERWVIDNFYKHENTSNNSKPREL